MSFDSLLINIVTITRPTITYSYGVPTKTYTSVATGVKCSIQYRGGGGFGIGGGGALIPTAHGYEVVEGWIAAFKYGIDVNKDDRLTDERGRTFIVKSDPIDVTGRSHHIESQLAIEEEETEV